MLDCDPRFQVEILLLVSMWSLQRFVMCMVCFNKADFLAHLRLTIKITPYPLIWTKIQKELQEVQIKEP